MAQKVIFVELKGKDFSSGVDYSVVEVAIQIPSRADCVSLATEYKLTGIIDVTYQAYLIGSKTKQELFDREELLNKYLNGDFLEGNLRGTPYNVELYGVGSLKVNVDEDIVFLR